MTGTSLLAERPQPASSPVIDQLAPGLARISVRGADAINVYLLANVLVDSGSRFTQERLLASLAGRPIAAHALTHGHFDHQGASAAVCARFGVPLWCGEGDRVAVETGRLEQLMPHRGPLVKLLNRLVGGPRCPVVRSLREGDEVGGFIVLELPGHTPGSIGFWRESDRAVVLGDVLFHRNPVTLRPGLREPFRNATWRPDLNRKAARRVAALLPELVCFGHGPPLRDPDALQAFVASLP